MAMDRLAHADHYALTSGDKMRNNKTYRCHRTGRPVSRAKCIVAFGLPDSACHRGSDCAKGQFLTSPPLAA